MKLNILILILFTIILVGALAVRNAELFRQPLTTQESEMTILARDKEQQGELVSNFPKLPLPSGIEIISSRSSQDQGGKYFNAMFKSQGTFEEISEWFKNELSADGWNYLEQESNIDTKWEGNIVLTKGDMRIGIDFDEDEPGETEVTMNLTVLP